MADTASPAGLGTGKTTWKLASPLASVMESCCRAKQGLSLPVARGIGRRIGEELEGEHGIRTAIEGANHGRRDARKAQGLGQDGEILQVIRAARVAAGGVQGDAVEAQVDPQGSVVVDRVGQNGVAGAVVGGVDADIDAEAAVVGDHVPGSGDQAADRVVRRTIKDGDAALLVTQALRAVGADSDQVALDQVVLGGSCKRCRRRRPVAEFWITCSGGRPADRVGTVEANPGTMYQNQVLHWG